MYLHDGELRMQSTYNRGYCMGLGQGCPPQPAAELRGSQDSPGGPGRALKAELRIEAMVVFAFLGSLGCLAGGEHSWSS